MPTYEYLCPNGHDFEKFFRTISASESHVACPQCGAMGERHLSVGAGLVFKGSGFYLTDYGKNAHARRGDAGPSASGGEGGSGGDSAKSGENGGKQDSKDVAAKSGTDSPSAARSSSDAPPAPAAPSGSKSPAASNSAPTTAAPTSRKNTKRDE